MKYILLLLLLLCSFSLSQKNLSPIGTATQSSTYKHYVASLAVNGGPTNDFKTESCSHTARLIFVAWWMLTFPNQPMFIEKVVIYYRRDSGGVDGFFLYMGNTSITGTHKQTPPGHLCFHDKADRTYSATYTIQCTQVAQYVILYNETPKDAYGTFLELCDVQVIGCSTKRHGIDCQQECSMKCFDQHCYPSNGSCVWGCNCYDNDCNSEQTCTSGCKIGFGGQNCNENNLASSGFSSQYPEDKTTPAELAVDGIRLENSCAQTSGIEARWSLDLGKTSVIGTIYLTFRNNDTVKQYAKNHSLKISNSSGAWQDGPFIKLTSNSVFPFLIYNINPPLVGRYIIYEPEPFGGASHVDICEVEVVGCKLGFYGENCNKTCPDNCYGPCDLATGVCTFGCVDGWIYPYCNKSCDDSKFGHRCNKTCHCYNKTKACDHVTGTCPEGGCSKGWKGTSCSNECRVGQYGYNCNESCEGCLSKQCDIQSGECILKNDCNPGWFREPPFCKTKCPSGTFGKNCTNLCHCIDSSSCSRIDGVCSEGGCERGWEGDNCTTECGIGRYGFNCKYACNRCLNNTCNRLNGTCTYGCGGGYQNVKCELIENSLQQDNLSSGSAGTIAGIVVAAIIIIVVIVLIIFWRRRKGLKNNNAGSVRNTRSQNFYSNEVTDDTDKTVPNDYVNVHPRVSARGISVTLQEPAGITEDSEESMADSILKTVDNVYYNDTCNMYGNVKTDQKYKEHNIAIGDLSKFINEKHVENGFETEFESLPKGHVYPHTEAVKEENKLKNRFLTTWPYDHSRVVLTDNPSSDYINASYIDKYGKEKAYIATQGPKRNTIKDFWEMIWQENVKVIVMVTQLIESGRKKCEQYWPELHEKRLLVGNLKISMSQEKTRTVYVERVFSLLNKKVHTERTIRQFHFTQWPDHGVPDIMKLVTFYRKVKKEASHSDIPLVVHCSAGIGRTGTFLAIDALYEHGQRTGFINVMEYAQIMRKDRMNMIQTKDQYQTVFEALLELLTTSDTAIERNDFNQVMKEDQRHPIPKNQTKLYLEFQKLQSLKPSFSRAFYSKATAEENASKNSNDILAHDKYRPILISSTSDRTDYINAVILPEYNTPTNIIVTQYPLKDTLVDFWTMIYDQKCHVVVLLEETSNEMTLWPKKNTAIQFEMLTVYTIEDESDVDIKLTYKSNRESRHVKVITMSQWNPENIPASTRYMTDLLQNVSHMRDKLVGSVAVIDRDGASRSGLLVALMLVLQKLEIDDDVDIFQVVRMMQVRRPEFLRNYDQYEYCYQFLKDYLDSDSLYANA